MIEESKPGDGGVEVSLMTCFLLKQGCSLIEEIDVQGADSLASEIDECFLGSNLSCHFASRIT